MTSGNGAESNLHRSEPFPDLNDEILFPRLSDSKLEWLAERGTRRSFQTGDVLFEHAVRDSPFFVIERGLVELIDRKPGKDVVVAQIDSRTFIVFEFGTVSAKPPGLIETFALQPGAQLPWVV